MDKKIEGRVFIIGDDVNTDVIIPAKYLIHTEPEELAKYAFSPMGNGFMRKIKEFDIIAAGENFGCGSSREQAVTAIKGLKIKAVVARSFGRIFFRNAINSALPIIECPEAVNGLKEGDKICIDFLKNEIQTPQGEFSFSPIPESVFRIIEAGGLIEYLKATAKDRFNDGKT
jgi:3-isopropylmalate/(R)-2-methylmalate dehydratase small subunit